jgi:hypothetical protein
MSEGRKDDQGKLRWGLLRRGCVLALESIIRVLMYGAKKYGDDNWKAVEDAERRYRDALDRHLADIDRGVEIDKDTGEDNWAHVATNALFVLQLREARRAAEAPKVAHVAAGQKKAEPAWFVHRPGKRPEYTADLEEVEYRMARSTNPSAVYRANPRDLAWDEYGPATITSWRPA